MNVIILEILIFRVLIVKPMMFYLQQILNNLNHLRKSNDPVDLPNNSKK